MKLLQQSRGMQQPTLSSYHSCRILLLFHWPLESCQCCVSLRVCVCVRQGGPWLWNAIGWKCQAYYANVWWTVICFCMASSSLISPLLDAASVSDSQQRRFVPLLATLFFFLFFLNFICTSIMWTTGPLRAVKSRPKIVGLFTPCLTNVPPVLLQQKPARIKHS